jgi:heterodisulfide reductase subunit B
MIKHYEMKCNMLYYIFMFLKLQLTMVTKRGCCSILSIKESDFLYQLFLATELLISSTHYGKVYWNSEQPFSIASLLQLVLKHLPFHCHDSLCGHVHDPVNTFHIANIKKRKCTNKKDSKIFTFYHIFWRYINVFYGEGYLIWKIQG